MIKPPENTIQSSSNPRLDLLLGIFAGAGIALLGLWLWLGPGQSLPAILSAMMEGLLPSSWRALWGHEAHLLGLPLSGQTKAYWYMARAGGIMGYILLWLSVVWGLILSTKITEGLVPAPLAYGLHEFLSLGTILFATFHALILLGDSYIKFTIFHLTIPFSAPYEPLWTGLGTLGFYLSAVLTGSFYLRKQIGQKVWRALHYLTFGAYLLALVHGIMAGTDSRVGLIQLIYFSTGFSVLFLVYYRLFILKVKAPGSARR
jgi:predicted ferric reductase